MTRCSAPMLTMCSHRNRSLSTSLTTRSTRLDRRIENFPCIPKWCAGIACPAAYRASKEVILLNQTSAEYEKMLAIGRSAIHLQVSKHSDGGNAREMVSVSHRLYGLAPRQS